MCGTITGLHYAHKLSIRVNFWESYLRFINFVENEIRYSVDSIFNIIAKHDSSGNFKIFLSQCLDQMSKQKNFSESWSYALNKTASAVDLSDGDMDLIKSFGNSLGISDIDAQCTHCQLHKSLVEERLSCARDSKKTKSKLYVMLGISSSIILVLILI